MVGQGSGPISRRLCPQDSSTHAEAIALALAEQATRQFADRQFFTDSESLG